jgi:hypothetical protein
MNAIDLQIRPADLPSIFQNDCLLVAENIFSRIPTSYQEA